MPSNISGGFDVRSAEFSERVRFNQARLRKEMSMSYDFIVCGAGTSGSVVARRLAENPDVKVLLLEAGGTDDVPEVRQPEQWPLNILSERDWAFMAKPNPHINGRSLLLSMGKVLGGGSSINVMIWARGYKRDWDFFAEETEDPSWNYTSVLNIYRRIEDYRGVPDPSRRGSGGLVSVRTPDNLNPVATAMLDGARSVGIPTFPSMNGSMLEGEGGAALVDALIGDGKRLSIFQAYTLPYMDRPNLTILTNALVTRLLFDGKKATGVEFLLDGKTERAMASGEVVLSLGAVHTPKVLMLSGIGDETELRELGIPLIEHLPGVGRNFQDHVGVASCLWEAPQDMEMRNNGCEATIFWKSDPALDSPDLQPFQAEFPAVSPGFADFTPPKNAWSLFAGLVRPKSRGRVRLTGSSPTDPVDIEANTLQHPDDLKALVRCVELCREIGNSSPMQPFVKRELLPGTIKGRDLEDFVRNGAATYWHQTCTAKMGRDSMSVVDSNLRV